MSESASGKDVNTAKLIQGIMSMYVEVLGEEDALDQMTHLVTNGYLQHVKPQHHGGCPLVFTLKGLLLLDAVTTAEEPDVQAWIVAEKRRRANENTN